MASSMDYHRTPNCEVHWAGFRSDTYTLQSCGWQAAVEHAHNAGLGMGRVSLILRHDKTGWAMYCESRESYGYFMEEAWPGKYGRSMHQRPPTFEVTHCRPDHQLLYFGSRPLNRHFTHVDLHPQMNGQPVSKGCIFPPWREAAEEIIVEPDRVADLLERIHKLQEPELAAIRQRNRDRDRRDAATPIRHATILSLAA